MGEALNVVKGFYDAMERGDAATGIALLAPDIIWREAESHPYADRNPYEGLEALMSGVFGRLGAEWTGFASHAEEFLDAGDKVVVLGRYTGVCNATGKALDAQMVHVWSVAGGKLKTFQQYADTLKFAQAMKP